VLESKRLKLLEESKTPLAKQLVADFSLDKVSIF
jgi:hypothetical protein